MTESKKEIMTIILEVFSLFFSIVGTYLMFTTSSLNQVDLTYFGILIGIVIIAFIFVYGYNEYNKMKERIENNSKTIEEIEKNLKFKELFDKMNVRVKMLEELLKLKRKGNLSIDPRLIIIIALIIVFLLFLRSIGKI